jgi:hypothetical protein
MNMVSFRLEVDDNSTSNEVAVIDVCTKRGQNIMASLSIKGRDFRQKNRPEEFTLRFNNDGSDDDFEFRVIWRGRVKMIHHRTAVAPLYLENDFATGVYNWGTDADDLVEQRDLGMTFFMDYNTWLDSHFTRIFSLLREQNSTQKIILNLEIRRIIQTNPNISHHTQVDQEAIDAFYAAWAARVEANRDRIAAIYIQDEPTLTGWSHQQIGWAIEAVQKYMPALPTMVTYYKSSAARNPPRGLTYAGLDNFYNKPNVNIDRLFDPFIGMQTKIFAVPRAFTDDGKCCNQGHNWTPEKIAAFNDRIIPALKNHPAVVGALWYAWADTDPAWSGTYTSYGITSMPPVKEVLKKWFGD